MRHCSTCNCADDAPIPQPSTSSEWARRQAREAARAAVDAARAKRLGKPGPEPILSPEQHAELMRWQSPVIEGEVAE